MKWSLRALVGLAVLGGLAMSALAQGDLTDPYEILARHFDSIGGLPRLRAETTTYFKGDLKLEGLSGTIEHWQERPGKSRTEVDLGVFEQTQGDNGEFSWVVDSNGKLTINRDEAGLKRRELRMRLDEFEQLDRNSDVFDVTLDGTEEVEGDVCYVVRTTNSINDDVILEYYDVDDFRLVKSSAQMGATTQITYFHDYRDVDGILRSFRQEMEYLPLGQKQTLDISEYVVNPEIDPQIFEPPSEDVRDFTFPEGATEVVVPFEFIENHLFVPVMVDCHEWLWVLDTGASMSVIDRGYARKLGLEPEGSMTGAGAGNKVEVSFVTLPPYRVGDIEFAPQKLAVIDISDLFRSTSDLEIAGILGYDFLSRFVTRVDYANETLTFYDPSAFEYEGEGVVIDAPLSGNTFTLPVTVDGEYGGRWSLDLGASGTSFHYPYAVAHGLLDRPGIEVVGFGAGGKVTKELQAFDTIELAGDVVDDAWIGVPDKEVVGAFANTDLTGNLGNTLFRHFVLTLDYGRQQVIVERGDDFGRDFPRDKTGLFLWRPEEAVEVLFVSPGTAGDVAGFREGDTVVSINGIPVELLDGLIALRRLGREAAGTEYAVGILRGGEPMELRLKLRDLF